VGKAFVTAGIGALDSFVLWAGTMTTVAFVHRWVLMAVGIATGIVWAIVVFPRSVRAVRAGLEAEE